MIMIKKKMTTSARPRKRRKPMKPHGARAMLLALALGGTLGGWVGLSTAAIRREAVSAPAPAAPVEIVTAPASAAAPHVAAVVLSPIPTIQPPPAQSDVSLTTPMQALPQSATTLAPIPAVPQPVIQRPVTRTRSSR